MHSPLKPHRKLFKRRVHSAAVMTSPSDGCLFQLIQVFLYCLDLSRSSWFSVSQASVMSKEISMSSLCNTNMLCLPVTLVCECFCFGVQPWLFTILRLREQHHHSLNSDSLWFKDSAGSDVRSALENHVVHLRCCSCTLYVMGQHF